MYSDKIEFDKFYTKRHVAKDLIRTLDQFEKYDLIIEPSAGNGSFLFAIEHENKIGIDIEPEAEGIIKTDWLKYQIPTKYQRVLIIGNPPFGRRNNLSKAFIKHACSFSNVETIAFILPNVYNKHTLQKCFAKEFRLKNIIELPKYSFEINGEDYHVPCSFFVYDKSEGKCLRFNPELYKETNDWLYGTKNDYDFFVMGAAINTVKSVPEKTNRGYFIKVKNTIDVLTVKSKFQNLTAKGNSSVSGGAAWLTKPELVKIYKETYEPL